MGLPTSFNVGDKVVFLTADRLEDLVKEVLPNWSKLDVVLGRSLDGETTDEAVRQLEAALREKRLTSATRFHTDWVRFELSEPREIQRNIWALIRDYCYYYDAAEVEADSPEPIYVGKSIDNYPLYEVFTVHYPVFTSPLRAGVAHLIHPPQTAIRIRVSRIRKVMGTLQGFALLSEEFAVVFRPRHICTILEPITTEHQIELFKTTFGPL